MSALADRDRMLAAIRASLAQSRAQLAAEAARASHTPPAFVHPPQPDLPAQFAAELARLEGHPHRCASDTQALDAIHEILQRHQASRVVAWGRDQIGLPGLDGLLAELGIDALDGIIRGHQRIAQLQALEPAPICISGADAGIAESGTIVVRSGAGRGRLASLIAPVHIAVLRAEQIVRGLGAALTLLRERYGPDPLVDSSNLTLISGPSRTGDIELTLTLGVHGPREIHVVLID
ncbi:MAG TPA: lactate utilization protein [Roseiflexaceae bacterium]|nr:lactate utilization protein [Roseiflexaceae bacterium]